MTSLPLTQYHGQVRIDYTGDLVTQLRALGEIHVPRYPGREGEFCSVPLRNIGPGVAFLRSNSVSDGRTGFSWNGKFSSIVVPSGELTRITFAIPADRDEQPISAEDSSQVSLLLRLTSDTQTSAVLCSEPSSSSARPALSGSCIR